MPNMQYAIALSQRVSRCRSGAAVGYNAAMTAR